MISITKLLEDVINFLGWIMLIILICIFVFIGCAVIEGIIEGFKTPIN